MRGWRKMTWAIVLWTGLIAVWAMTGVNAVSTDPRAGSAAYQVGVGIGLTFLFMIWFIGFIVLAILWFMTRPKANVTVYGPAGQQVMVSEKEARQRVERQGWRYQATGGPVPPSATVPGDFNWSDEEARRASRVCVNCGKKVADDREQLCDHCGLPFATKAG